MWLQLADIGIGIINLNALPAHNSNIPTIFLYYMK